MSGTNGPERIYIGCCCEPGDPDCACEQRWTTQPYGSGNEDECCRRDLIAYPAATRADVWLAPACADELPGYEREWCEDEFDPCPDCGELPVPYVLVRPRPAR